eukprot:761057-Hanusia_phi.AAC.2
MAVHRDERSRQPGARLRSDVSLGATDSCLHHSIPSYLSFMTAGKQTPTHFPPAAPRVLCVQHHYRARASLGLALLLEELGDVQLFVELGEERTGVLSPENSFSPVCLSCSSSRVVLLGPTERNPHTRAPAIPASRTLPAVDPVRQGGERMGEIEEKGGKRRFSDHPQKAEELNGQQPERMSLILRAETPNS